MKMQILRHFCIVPVLWTIFLIVGCDQRNPYESPPKTAEELSALSSLGAAKTCLARYSDEQALQCLDEAIELDPTLSEAFFLRAQMREKNGEIDAAYSDYMKVAGRGEMAVKASVARGLIHESREEMSSALKAYNKAIDDAVHRKNAPYCKRGMIFMMQGKKEEAIEDFTVAIDSGCPDAALALCHRATLHVDRREVDAALKDLTTSIELDPAYLPSYLHRARIYNTQEKYAEAIADATHLIDADYPPLSAYECRGIAYSLSGDHERAIADLSHCIANGCDFVEVLACRAASYVALENYDGALTDSNSALEEDPENLVALRARGIALYHVGNKYEAMKDFNIVAKHNRRDALVQKYRAIIATMQDTLEVAIDLNPDDPELHLLRAKYNNRRIGFEDSALEDFTKVIELDPMCAEAYLGRAQMYQTRLRPREAMKDYTMLIEKYPDNPEYYVKRGYLRKSMMFYDHATADFQKALELDPEEKVITRRFVVYELPYHIENEKKENEKKENERKNAEYRERQERLYAGAACGDAERLRDKGDFDGAFERLEAFLKNHPSNTIAKNGLSDTYVARGKLRSKNAVYTRAIEDFEKALDLNPDNREAKSLYLETQEKMKE